MSNNESSIVDLYNTRRTAASTGPSSQQEMAYNLNRDATDALNTNPWLANDPEALMQIAQSGQFGGRFVDQSAQLFGMQSSDQLLRTMNRLSEGSQRGAWGQLTQMQQGALVSMGYGTPETETPGASRGFIDGAKTVLGAPFKAVSTVVSKPIGLTLNALDFMEKRVSNFYRAIRTQDSDVQWAALGGAAAAGAAAFIAAPATAGASLGTLGAIGAVAGGALAGGTAATMIATSPQQWWESYQETWDGEASFRRSSQREARELLAGDEQLASLARDIAWNSEVEDLYDLAETVSSVQDAGGEQQKLASISRVAATMAEEGTPEFARAYELLFELVQVEEFAEAIRTLESGKISPGRDIARLVTLDPGDIGYGTVSGSIDALWLVAVDPTLALGKFGQARKVRRRSISMEGKSAGIRTAVANNKDVARAFETLATAVRTDHFDHVAQRLPEAQGLFMPLTSYKRLHNIEDFNVNHLLDYLDQPEHFSSIMAGQFTKRGEERLLLASLPKSRVAFNRIKLEVRSAIQVLDDSHMAVDLTDATRLEKAIRTVARKKGVEQDIFDQLPSSMFSRTDVKFNQVSQASAEAAPSLGRKAGEFLDHFPGTDKVGAVLGSLISKLPPGTAVDISGNSDTAAAEISQMVEMSRMFGVQSDVRRWWTDAILAQDNKTLRIHAASAYVDSMLHAGGLYATKEGEAIANQFITRWRQTYGFVDDVTINGRPRRVGELPMKHDADQIVIPDFKEMRQSIRRGILLSSVLRVTDSNFVEQRFMGFWKPAVLLRIGFVPRAAGEELLALLARTQIRDFTQIRRGKWHLDRDIDAAVRKEQLAAESIELSDGTVVPAVKRVLMNKTLVEAQQQRWAPGTRWAGNMLARSHEGNPIINVLDRYASFLDNITRTGVANKFTFANKIENASNPYQAGAWSMFESVAVGKPRSMRNMWLNGVDPEITVALKNGWFRGHVADDVMREISAGVASVIASERPNNHIIKALEKDRDGVLKEIEMVVFRGAFEMVQRGDDHFAAGVHQFQREPFDDVVVSPAIAEVLPGYLDPELGLSETVVDRVSDLVTRMDELIQTQDVPLAIRGLLGQLLGSSNESTWRGFYETIQETDPRMATVVWEAMNNDVRTLGPNNLSDMIDHYDELLPLHDLKNRNVNKPMRSGFIGQGQLAPKVEADLNKILQEFSDIYTTTDDAQRTWVKTFTSARRNNPNMEISRSYVEMQEKLVEKIRLRLLMAENQKWVQGSVKAHTVGGKMMTSPAADNTVRMFASAVPANYVTMVRNQNRYNGTTEESVELLIGKFNERKHIYVGNDEGFVDIDDEVLRAVFRRYMQIPNDKYSDVVQAGVDLGQKIPVALVATTDPRVARSVGMFFEDMVTGKVTMGGPVTQFDVASDASHMRHGVQNDGITPITFDGPAGQEVYSIDVNMLGDRGMRVPNDAPMTSDSVGISYEQMIDTYAASITEETVLARFRDLGGTHSVKRNDGNKVFTVDGAGNKMPVEVGARTMDRTTYQLEDGTSIDRSQVEYFDMANNEASQRITWETVGPMLQDHFDLVRKEQTSIIKRTPTDLEAKVMSGDQLAVNSGQPIPALRAHPSQVGDIPEGMQPSMIATEIYNLNKRNDWSEFVDKGFGAIARSIDAIVRRPMALHMYVNAYTENSKRLRWLYDDNTIQHADDQLGDLLQSLGSHATDEKSMEFATHLATARKDRVPTTPFEARMYLSASYDFADEDALKQTSNVIANQIEKAGGTADRTLKYDFQMIAQWGILRDKPGAETLINRVTAIQPMQEFGSVKRMPFPELNDKQQGAYKALQNNMDHAQETIAGISKQRAIENTVPFLDSHQFKSQFAEWGRGIMPFWYAEENFLKRVARTATIAPETIRKMQIAYMGIKEVGLIRTDQNGKDWFVYPGSQALGDAIAPLMGVAGLENGGSMGLFFEASTDQLLPGYSGEPGRPSFAPMLTIGMDYVTDLFPELEPIQRAVVGDLSTSRSKIDQLVPTTITRALGALGLGGQDSYASNMMAAMALMAANDQIPENPTTREYQQILDRASNHARMIGWTKLLVGFVSPGSPRASHTGGGEGFDLTAQLGVDNVNIADVFNARYRELITQLGIDEGTQEYLKENPDDTMFEFVNPLAFTLSKSNTESGASMPTSITVMDHYDENENWYQQYQLGGPWLFPQDDDPFSSQAYNAQVKNGLRTRKTSEEFLDEYYRKDGSVEYYKKKGEYEELRDAADDNGRKVLDSQWREFSGRYMKLHPIFAAEHMSTDRRTRRQTVLRDLIVAAADPERPVNKHSDSVIKMVETFQQYDTQRRILSRDRTGDGRDKLESLKTRWRNWGEEYVMWNPNVEGFWMSIIEPQSELN
jgi:hypothetical protein